MFLASAPGRHSYQRNQSFKKDKIIETFLDSRISKFKWNEAAVLY